MKKIFYILSLALIFVATSCEKVIDLDVNSEDPKYVIEGIVTKDSTKHIVKITRTLNFDETTSFPTVDNANVVITDNLGNSTTLALIAPGTYQSTNYLGVEGRTYTITVNVDGKTFTSSSTMPTQVVIDTLTLQNFSFGSPTPLYYPVANRMDPLGIRNFYSFNLYKNGDRVNGIFIQDDQFADGDEFLQPIFGGDYETGDTLILDMFCIDEGVHKYFNTLSINSQGTSGAVPANPDSNFGSSCLGYFSAQTSQRKTLVIP